MNIVISDHAKLSWAEVAVRCLLNASQLPDLFKKFAKLTIPIRKGSIEGRIVMPAEIRGERKPRLYHVASSS
jgi:hypothetical protein